MYIIPMSTLVEPIKYDYHLTPETPFYVYQQFAPPKHSIVPPDVHYSLHFGIMLKGAFEVVYSDSCELKKSGDVWFCGPWEPHAAHRIGVETEIILITIMPEKLGDIGLGGSVNWMQPFVIPVANRPHVTNDVMRAKVLSMAREIEEIAEKKELEMNIALWLKLHELLLFLIKSNNFYNGSKMKDQNVIFERIQPAIKLVREMTGRPIALEEAASACCLGKSRFCVLFQAAMGTTFAKYATRTRISMAASYIKKNNCLIKEIAEMWGFFDESHFYRVFKKYFKCSPSEYRSMSEITSSSANPSLLEE
jgi:AraC-like DNA-binding protein/quercetin dioxygenase-like cupin family protein